MLLEKLTVHRLVRLATYGTQWFISIFARSRRRPKLGWPHCSSTSLYAPLHPIALKSMSIFLHIGLGLPSDIFSSGFTTKISCSFLFSRACYMLRLSHTYLIVLKNINYIATGDQTCSSLILYLPCFSQYSPKHLVLKHCQFVFS